MYKYKSWHKAAVQTVASIDEDDSAPSRTPPTPLPPPTLTLLNHPPHASTVQSIVPRRPQVGRELVPSSFRPHVPATDRIRLWQTPHSLSFNAHVASYLPPKLVDSSFNMIYRSLTPATRSTYGAGLLRFTQFCDKYNISESDRMPASFILLVAFISEHTGSVSGKTICGWLSTLKAWHDTNSTEWCGDSRWLQMAQVTASKEGTAFRKKQRDPVTVEHLITLYDHLDLSDCSHAACWAIATCCFWGVCQFVFPIYVFSFL